MGALFIGVGFFTMCLLVGMIFLEFIKDEKTKTQIINNELQSRIDNMTPREFYVQKISQNNLVWDHRTQAYIRKWAEKNTTYH